MEITVVTTIVVTIVVGTWLADEVELVVVVVEAT